LIYPLVAKLSGSQPDIVSVPGPPIVDYYIVSYLLVNSLWLSSLVISLMVAVLAILLQQWARRYYITARQLGSPHSQAQVRQFLSDGIHDSGIAILVDVMMACHHTSFVLFIAGLLVHFSNTNLISFLVMIVWCGLWTVGYLVVSSIRFFRNNSPYYTPLSSLVYRIFQLQLFVFFTAQYLLGRKVAVSTRVQETLRKFSPKDVYSLGYRRISVLKNLPWTHFKPS